MKRQALLIALLLPSLIILNGCKEKIKPGNSEAHRPVVAGVAVDEMKPVEVIDYIEAAGTVKARNTSLISSKVMGTVTSVKVKEGDKVKAGTLLLTIDDSDLSQRAKAAEAGQHEAEKALEAAKAQRDLADITYLRYKSLYDQKALSRQELDQIETQKNTASFEYDRVKEMVERTRAGAKEARAYSSYARITSPSSGVVTEKRVDAGTMAAPGIPLMVVEDRSSFTVDANADESLFGKLRPGTTVGVSIDSIGRNIKGTIEQVVPSINPQTRTFLIKVRIPDGNLSSGLYAKVLLPAGRRQAILVPQDALLTRGQLTGVFTVDTAGAVTYRLIKAGPTRNGMVEVLSGLNPGDRVITSGAEKAIDGGVIQSASSLSK